MLAIIIPYYKLTFFEATLQSLARQTNQQFKVYIGDDGSPENPLILLEKYKDALNKEFMMGEGKLGKLNINDAGGIICLRNNLNSDDSLRKTG